MKHQYTTDIIWKRLLQYTIDFFIDVFLKFFIKKSSLESFIKPQKILFVSLGHLGDALILSYLFPFIHSKYPEVYIDVLTSEWCNPIFKNNPYIRKTFFFDHFRMNKNKISFLSKIKNHRKSHKSALNTIIEEKYDLSIAGKISHPNGNILCYRGKIKRRIGFGSGGFGSFLTDEVLLPTKINYHTLDALLLELEKINIYLKLETIKPYFILSNDTSFNQHSLSTYFNKSFVILHPESAKDYIKKRTVSKKFWLDIVRIILDYSNLYIIVCGTSSTSLELIELIKSDIEHSNTRIVDAVKKLSIDEFFILSKYAKVAFTVDSLPAHLCAINCNTISFYKNCIKTLFFPISNNEAIVIHNNLLSKDAKISTHIRNYYVENIESNRTYEIVNNSLNTFLSRG